MGKLYVIDKKYLEKNINSIDLQYRLVIINPKVFKEEFRDPKHLICRVLHGAGCRYSSFGTAIFSENIYDGEKFRSNRLDVINVVKKECEDEVIEKYCK